MRGARERVVTTFVITIALVASASAQATNRADAFAIAGERNDTVLPLPKSIPSVKYAEMEMKLMSTTRPHVLGVFPSETSSYCERSSVKGDWRRFARVLDFAGKATEEGETEPPTVWEATHEGKEVSRIVEVKCSRTTRQLAKRLSCGFIAVAKNNDMAVFPGNSSDGSALAGWLSDELTGYDDIEVLKTRHEVTEFVERNETIVRAIILEETPWLKTLSFSGKVAVARASSLVGSKYLHGLSYYRTGMGCLLFVPDIERMNDEDRSKRVDVRIIERKNNTLNFYDVAEAIINAELEIGYTAMVESAIDVDCANAVWTLASNSIHPEYALADELDESESYKVIAPPKAWDIIKGDLLDLLDGHGKGDKTLVPKQWLCGLAGLTAAHRDVANEFAEAATDLAELETLRKENLALRQRNAVLEREVARCDSSRGPRAPRGSARLPKAKPAGWGFEDAKKGSPPIPRVERPERHVVEEIIDEEEQAMEETATVDDYRDASSVPVRDEL